MARKRTTRTATKSDAASFLAKAVQFAETMDQALLSGQWDSAGLQAVHCVISTADALMAFHGGLRSAEQDHRAAAMMLRDTLGPDAESAARHISAVVAKKNTVEYDQLRS